MILYIGVSRFRIIAIHHFFPITVVSRLTDVNTIGMNIVISLYRFRIPKDKTIDHIHIGQLKDHPGIGTLIVAPFHSLSRLLKKAISRFVIAYLCTVRVYTHLRWIHFGRNLFNSYRRRWRHFSIDSPIGRFIAHDKLQSPAINDFFMLQPAPTELLTVQFGRLNIDILIACIRSQYFKHFSSVEINCRFRKYRTWNKIYVLSRIRIKSHWMEYIPSRHRPRVVISGQPRSSRIISLFQNPTDNLRRLVGTIHIVIQAWH